MKRNTNYLNKRIIELSEEYESDIELNEVTLHDTSMKVPGIKCKWLKIYYEESNVLNVLKDKLDDLEKDFIRNFKNKNNETPEYVIKMEFEKFKNASDDVAKLKSAVKQQSEVVRYSKELLEMVKGLGWDIQNCTKILDLENR